MKVTKREPSNLVLSNTGGDRAPGLHLSDVIKVIMYERDKKFNPNDPMDMMRIEAGFTWEEILSHSLARRYRDANPPYQGKRPEPFQKDGIWMSPDWVNPGSDWPLEEWKATKVSSKSPFMERQWYWPIQMMGYAHGMGVTAAILRVWYINGDYSYDSNKSDLTLLRDYHEYELEFTQRDLEDNWRSVLGYARRYGLLKDEEPEWHEPQQQPKSRRSSQAQPPSKRVLKFPSGRTLPKPPVA